MVNSLPLSTLPSLVLCSPARLLVYRLLSTTRCPGLCVCACTPRLSSSTDAARHAAHTDGLPGEEDEQLSTASCRKLTLSVSLRAVSEALQKHY